MAADTFSQQYVRGEAHFGAWGLATKSIGVVNTIITLSAFTLYQYGVFQLVLALYGAATYLTAIGNNVVGNDITHFIREGEEGKAKKLFYEYNALRLAVSILLFGAFFFGATLFAERYTFGFVAEIRTVSFLFLTEFFFTATQSLLAARLKFGAVASRPAIAKAAQLVALLAFLLAGHLGIEELFLSMIFGSVVSTVTMAPAFFALARQWAEVPFSKERILVSIFATYGKWALYRQAVGQLVARIQPWLVKIFVGTEAVAIFSVASALISAIEDIGFPVKTLSTLVPLHMADADKARRIFVLGSRYLFLLSIVVSVVAAGAASFAVYLALPKYAPSLPYFYAMLPAIPITALGVITGTFLIAFRRQKYLFWLGVEKNAVIIAFYALAVPLIGLWGLAIEESVTPFIALMTQYLYLKRTKPGGFDFSLRELVVPARGDMVFLRSIRRDAVGLLRARLGLQ